MARSWLTGWTGRADAARWLVLVAVGLALTYVAVAARLHLGTASAPFIGRYRFKLEPGTLLAPAVAACVLAAVRARLHERVSWRWLLAGGYAAAVAWAVGLAVVDGGNGLAGPVDNPNEYLRDVPAVHGDPAGFLAGFVRHASDGSFTIATRQHPPGPVLLLWLLGHAGLGRPEVLGLVITLIGCLHVVLVALATRSLCGEAAARRLLPVLILAPYAVWLAVSMDAVTLTLTAAGITCGVLASEPGRRLRSWLPLGALAGLALGVAALFSYAAGWLALSLVVTYFVRRRPKLNVVTGVAALLPLAMVNAYGFDWAAGLTAAQADFSLRVGPHRSWLLWAPLDLLVLVMAAGPAIVPAARKIRRTPGWPFLIGAGLAVGFALGSGLSRGEVERSWLPFFPWLLVPAVAPERRPVTLPEDSAPTPSVLVGVGAITAIVIQCALRTAW